MMRMKTIIIAVILTGGAGGLVCGPALADFESGQTAYAAGRQREAFLEWESDADRGNPVAQYFIGNMYASGEGVDQDLEIANSFYKKAAEQGHVESAALVHFDSFGQAGERIQQYRTGAEIGRHFEAVDAAAERGSEQPGGTGQPGSNIENAIFGPDLRQLQQLA